MLGLKNNQYMRYDGTPVRDSRSQGFRSWYGWSRTGARDDRLGERYMLSTMLAITTSRGNKFYEVRKYLTSAAAADGTKPSGTIYFAKNDNIRSKTRAKYFDYAAQQIRAQGVAAEVIEATVPLRKFAWLER